MTKSSQVSQVKHHGKILHGVILARHEAQDRLSELTAQAIDEIVSDMDMPGNVRRADVSRFFNLASGHWSATTQAQLKLIVSREEASDFFLSGEIPILLRALKHTDQLCDWGYSSDGFKFEVCLKHDAIAAPKMAEIADAICEVNVLMRLGARKWQDVAQELPASLPFAKKYDKFLVKHGLDARTLDFASRAIFEGYSGPNFAHFEPVHYESNEISEDDAGKAVACLRDLGFVELSEDANGNLLLRPRIISLA